MRDSECSPSPGLTVSENQLHHWPGLQPKASHAQDCSGRYAKVAEVYRTLSCSVLPFLTSLWSCCQTWCQACQNRLVVRGFASIPTQ